MLTDDRGRFPRDPSPSAPLTCEIQSARLARENAIRSSVFSDLCSTTNRGHETRACPCTQLILQGFVPVRHVVAPFLHLCTSTVLPQRSTVDDAVRLTLALHPPPSSHRLIRVRDRPSNLAQLQPTRFSRQPAATSLTTGDSSRLVVAVATVPVTQLEQQHYAIYDVPAQR